MWTLVLLFISLWYLVGVWLYLKDIFDLDGELHTYDIIGGFFHGVTYLLKR